MTTQRTLKDCLVRAGRTFVQAAAGYIVANSAAYLMGASDGNMLKSAIVGLGVSAIAAGLAAIMNMPKGTRPEGGAENE